MDWDDLHFVDPRAEVGRSTNRLPHLHQPAVVYFVTFRLADSLPAQLLARWTQERATWLSEHPRPWDAVTEHDHRHRFTLRMEQWLDAGHGRCLLRDRANAEIVRDTLLHFDPERCRMLAFVIMPNHVHTLFQPVGEWAVDQLLHSWRRFSSRAINGRTNLNGTLWQKDYFDRMVRDLEHFSRCVRYIRANPGRAGIDERSAILFQNELARQVE